MGTCHALTTLPLSLAANFWNYWGHGSPCSPGSCGQYCTTSGARVNLFTLLFHQSTCCLQQVVGEEAHGLCEVAVERVPL